MQIKGEQVFLDGSGWTASVCVRGIWYACNHVAGRVSVQMGPYKRAPRAPKWAAEYVRKWAVARVAALSPEYHAAHRAVYDLPDVSGELDTFMREHAERYPVRA